jgi:phospholipase/carboxylesterase
MPPLTLTDMSQTPLMPDTLQWLPAKGQPEQLMILLHGWGASAADMVPLAKVFRHQFPQAVVLVPDGFEDADSGLAGRQWFSLDGVTDANRPERMVGALTRLAQWVKDAQAATGLGQQATALVGFSQGAICALELIQRHDGLAGRVLAFAGRYAQLPKAAPQATTLHFFHGADDDVIAADHAREAIHHLGAMQGDATLDIAKGVGHEVHDALIDSALHRLTHHIPHRTWRAAMGHVPPNAEQLVVDQLDAVEGAPDGERGADDDVPDGATRH